MTYIILETIEAFNDWRDKNKKDIDFIPTMGNIHEGHKELIKRAKTENANLTLVSIFINPLQFDNKNDFKNYPKTINNDIKNCFLSGADAIFIPSSEEIYPNTKKVDFVKASNELSGQLCGSKRFGHFDGVCTVIKRLLEIIQPRNMFLGEKDWQQVQILKRMIIELRIKTKIKTIATQRDPDGIAYSSRNNLLSKIEKYNLKIFSQELHNLKRNFLINKKINLEHFRKTVKNINVKIEYLEHLDAFNLKKPNTNANITIFATAIFCGKTRLIDHIFLMKRNPIIAIDGPAGAGKSTVTKLVARKLNFLYLDTGAMYRALSWFLINNNINFKNKIELKDCLKDISIIFKSENLSEQNIFINNYCVTNKIRSQEITSVVSSIAAISEVRKFLVNAQRKIGENGSIVAEGRDIGSTVFPNAEIKIFLTATIDERAKRRKNELENNGVKNINFEELKEQISRRDYADSNRKDSPLVQAKDAYKIISDGYSVDSIVNQIIDIYKETIPKELQ